MQCDTVGQLTKLFVLINFLIFYLFLERRKYLHWLSMEGERTPLLNKGGITPSSQPDVVNHSRLQWDPIRGRKAATLVLLALTLERLAYYALLANLLVFLSLGGNPPREAMTAVLVVGAIAHFSALGGGWLSDGALGG